MPISRTCFLLVALFSSALGSAQQLTPLLDAKVRAPFTVTYNVVVPGLQGEAQNTRLTEAKKGYDELTKSKAITPKQAQDLLAQAAENIPKEKDYVVMFATDGDSFLYKEMEGSKLLAVVIIGEQTQYYQPAIHRLDIDPGQVGTHIRFWPYLPFSISPFVMFKKGQLPSGVTLSDFQVMKPNDEFLGTLQMGVVADPSFIYLPCVVSHSSPGGEISSIHPSADTFVNFNKSIVLDSVQLPTSVSIDRYGISAAPPGSSPRYRLSPYKTASVNFEMVSHSEADIPSADFEMSTYLAPKTVVYSRGVVFHYSPGGASIADTTKRELKLRGISDSGSPPRPWVLISMLAVGVLLVGGIYFLRLRKVSR